MFKLVYNHVSCSPHSERLKMGFLHLVTFSTVINFLHLLNVPIRVEGIIPLKCVHNLTKHPAICCPIPSGESKPCGYPTRGKCFHFTVYDSETPPGYEWIRSNDIRQRWPLRVFQSGCSCFDQYGGYDCGECRFGYAGSRCQHRVRYIRRNIKTYSKSEKKRLQDILAATRLYLSDYVVPHNKGTYLSPMYKTISIQEELAAIHWFASYGAITNDKKICKTFSQVDYNHDGTGFIMWHRYFLLLWEYRTRQIAEREFGMKNFTFPYWDWTDAKSCEVCTDDIVCALSKFRSLRGGFFLSQRCPYSSWKVICSDVDIRQCTGCYFNKHREYISREFLTQRYPTTEDVEATLKFPVFYSKEYPCTGFSEYFEGGIGSCGCQYRLHSQVHMNILGPFNRSRTAANDPLFFLHHSQLDRLFQRWFLSVGPSKNDIPNSFSKPGHTRRSNLMGFYPPVKTEDLFVDLRSVGVDYDNYDFGRLKASTAVNTWSSLKYFNPFNCTTNHLSAFGSKINFYKQG